MSESELRVGQRVRVQYEGTVQAIFLRGVCSVQVDCIGITEVLREHITPLAPPPVHVGDVLDEETCGTCPDGTLVAFRGSDAARWDAESNEWMWTGIPAGVSRLIGATVLRVGDGREQ